MQLRGVHVLGNLGVVERGGCGNEIVHTNIEQPLALKGSTAGAAKAARDCEIASIDLFVDHGVWNADVRAPGICACAAISKVIRQLLLNMVEHVQNATVSGEWHPGSRIRARSGVV